MRTAHFDGYQLCVNARNDLTSFGSGDSRYPTWFGTYDSSRHATVSGKFATITEAMDTTTFTYDLTRGGKCKSSVYAYTFHGATTIHMCNLFFSTPATGTDSKAGTVAHEHSHATSGTVDLAYGQVDAMKLAVRDPDKAIRNADNYEYYAKG